MTEISVIVPVYNVEDYLARCLDSLLCQSFGDFEVICVNDGATDSSLKILEEYALKDKRIRIFNQVNQGLAAARNTGLKQAIGTYVLFLDSDDLIHPQLLEIVYSNAEQYQADLVSFSFHKISYGQSFEIVPFNDITKLKLKQTASPIEYCKRRSRPKIYYNVWSKFYRRSILQDVAFIPGIYWEDFPFTFAIMRDDPKTLILDAKLYYYMQNKSSISNSNFTERHIRDYHKALMYVCDCYKDARKTKHWKIILKNMVPVILKQILGRINTADIELRPKLLGVFRELLLDLNKQNCLSYKGHRLGRYMQYRKLIKS